MALRAVIREAIARRRERRKSKRMALRLAIFLSAVIALPFAYWQFQLHQVLKPASTTEELAAMCKNLDATVATVEEEAGRPIGTDKEALAERLSECDEMSIELTTGSVPE